MVALRRPAALAADLAVAAVAALVLLLRVPYHFESGDQTIYLILPYRQLFRNFLPGDWFTWETTHIHVTFAWIVRALHALAGRRGFADAALAAHGTVLLALALGVIHLGRAAGLGRFASWLALVPLVLLRTSNLGASHLNSGSFLPGDLALPPFLLACAAWLRGRPLAAGVWLGLGGFFHPNWVVLGPAVLGSLELAMRRGRERLRGPLLMAAGAAPLAAPTVWSMLRSFVAGDPQSAAVGSFVLLRGPHHYDPRAFPGQDFSWMALLLVLAVAGAAASARAARWRPAALVLGMLAMLAVGAVGTLAGSVTLTRVYAWRLAIPLAVLCCVLFVHGCAALLRADRRSGVLWLVGGALLLVVFGTGAQGTGWAAIGVPLGAALAAGALARGAARGGRIPVGAAAGLALLAVASVADAARREALLPALRQAAAFQVPRARPPIPLAERRLYSAIRRRLPRDARVLAPPDLQRFRLAARRAVFVDFKAAPMRGSEVAEWTRRMQVALQVKALPGRGVSLHRAARRLYARHSARTLARIARRERLTHVVATKELKRAGAAGLALIAKAPPFVVYEVGARPAKARGRAGEAARPAKKTSAAPADGI